MHFRAPNVNHMSAGAEFGNATAEHLLANTMSRECEHLE